MARFVHIEYPSQHAGLTRVTRGVAALRKVSATQAVLRGLEAIGRPFTRLGEKFAAALAASAEARQQRREDERLWAVALQDARVMADLSRAMSQAATDLRKMY